MATPVDPLDPDQAAGTGARRTEILAHLGRVLESREFRAARNRARFLEYVITRTLDGADHALKEYTIGVEVFDRGESFDPRTDGVVRTQAGLVRKHLERYYATEGRDEPIEIVLPKGHYVPEIRQRAGTDPQQRPAPDSELGRGGRPRPARRRWLWLGAAAGVASIAVLAAGAVRIARGADAPKGQVGPAARAGIASPDAPDGLDGLDGFLWAPFVAPGASNVLAFGVPQFFSAPDGIWIRDTEVNSAATTFRSGSRLDAIRRHLGTLQPAEAYTGIGEAYGVFLLSRFFLGRSHELRVVRSPTLSWDHLKHDNVIFLTSARFKTLANQLSYPADFVHVVGTPNKVMNLRPAPGEATEYVTQGGAVSIDHAVISLWPGKRTGRRVLVLSGGHTWGTQAAAEYVTEPDYLRDLHAHLLACQRRQALPRHPDFFQVLLRVEVRENQPIGIRYVTHHDLAIGEAGEPAPPQRAALSPKDR